MNTSFYYTWDEDQLKASYPTEPTPQIQPYTCPVCGGNGIVDNGFYSQTSGHWTTTDASPETCRSCGGTGIVWR